MTVSPFTSKTDGGASARFRLVPFNAIRLGTAPRYRVKGILPLTGLAVVYGPPKSGKSFVTFDVLMHVALAWPYQDRRVQPGSVVYCALEGQSGFEARKAAFEQRHLDGYEGPVPFYLMPAPLSLVADHHELIRAIRAQMPSSEAPAVVCLDTLNRSFIGSESDDQAMTAYVKAADAIRDAFDCLVVIVHHCGLEGSRPRGHTSLAGAVDAQLAVKKTGDGLIGVTVELMKDGPEGETLACRLEAVEVGIDEEGDPITSCIVEPIDDGDACRSRPPLRRMNDRHKLALAALTEASLNFGNAAPPSFELPAGIRTVPIERWREELHRRGIIRPDDSNPRATFQRLRDSLCSRELMAERDGLIWAAVAL